MELFKNEAQERVIEDTEGQMIVIACPGSGKTTTILRRIHHMVDVQGIDPSSILMVTFTKSAATEMKKRYSEMFGGNPGVSFFTIHALCLGILCRFGGYSPKCVLDDRDAKDYILPVIWKEDRIRDREGFIQKALTDISIVKNYSLDVKDYHPRCCQDSKLFQRIYKAYEDGLKKDGLIDYDDMMILSLKLIREDADLLDVLRRRYAYIHVDEYQDTNPMQRDFIYLLAGPEGNLTVVGDDDQSIYAFRGAKPEIMLKFKEQYPKAKEVYMTTNYRSDKNIISVSDALIHKNTSRFSKQFIGNSEENGSVLCEVFRDRDEELMCVVNDVQKLLENGTDPNEIAILYRLNAQSSLLTEFLNEAGIAFHSTQKVRDLYQDSVFRDIKSYFLVAHGEGTKADFRRTVLHPNRWLSGVDFETCGLNADAMISQLQRKIDWSKDYRKALFRCRKIPENAHNYMALIQGMAAVPADRAIELLYNQGGYRKYLVELSDWTGDPPEFLLSQVDALLDDIKKWGVKSFYEWEARILMREKAIEEKQKKSKGITLSTIHSAKGLEWDHVFLIDCIDQYMPYHGRDGVNDEEEERRLFYVGMTRARHDLRLCTYKYGLEGKTVVPSRFLKEAGFSF